MFLNKRSNGYYYVHYKDENGRWKSTSTNSTTKPEANRFFTDFKNDSSKNTCSALSLQEYCDQYLSYSNTNHAPQSTQRIKYVLQHFVALFPKVQLQKITPQHLEQFKTHRLKRVSAVTVNIELRTMKSFFGTAAKWNLIECNPFHAVKMVRIPTQ